MKAHRHKKFPAQDSINLRLKELLDNTGDMALKRRAQAVITGLDLKPGQRIIDVGCGNGYYVYLLSRLPIRLSLVGLDDSRKAIKDAKMYLNDRSVRLIVSDIVKIPFSSNSFDRVVMSEVVEHLDDPRQALKEVFRVLKKDGKLVLTTTNLNHPFWWDPINWFLKKVFNWHIRSGFWAGIWNQHSVLYTKQQTEEMISQAGLTIETSRNLTYWCLPFNHYIVNLIAILVYNRKIPANFSESLLKFKEHKNKPWLIKFAFGFVNLWDKMNDYFPQKQGVSIVVVASKRK